MFRIFSQYVSAKSFLLLILESILMVLCMMIAVRVRFWNDPIELARYEVWPEFGVQIAVVVLVCLVCFYFNDLYNLKTSDNPVERILRVEQSVGAASLLLGMFYFLFPGMLLSRYVFLIGMVLIGAFLGLGRRVLDKAWKLSAPVQRVAILGTGPLALELARELTRRGDLSMQLEGFLSTGPLSQEGERIFGFPVLGSTANMEAIASDRDLSRIIVALEDRRGILPTRELVTLRVKGLRVDDAPSALSALTGRISLNAVKPSWFVFSDGFHRSKWTEVLKRALDLAAGIVGMVVALPLMILVGIAIRLESRGAEIYRQTRVGRMDKCFEVLKFRSMCVDAEKANGAQWASRNDPRVTRIGAFLRKYRLDELPQFWNVIRGEMSFVGPRPERPSFVEDLRQKITYYDERHSVRPGLTGWAQVQYSYGASVEDAYKKLEYDLFYLKNMSLTFDLAIILKTIKIVAGGHGGKMNRSFSPNWKRASVPLVLIALAFTGCVQSPQAKIAQYLREGKVLMQKRDPARAILQFRNAVQAAPKNDKAVYRAEAYYQLALAYLAQRDYRNTVAYLKMAIALNPQHAQAKLRLAQMMASVTDPNVLKDAQQRLRALLEVDPDDPDALHALALTEIKLGDAANATQHLALALDDASESQELTIAITMALVKLQQKDAKGAEDVLKKACEESSRPADAMVYLGDFYISQHRLAEAEQQFEWALSLNPSHSRALFSLAKLQYTMGQKPEADQSFKRLSGLPGFKSVYAIYLFQTGRKDEAVREFERLSKADPKDRLMRTQLVSVYLNLHRRAEAEALLNRVLKKNSKDLDALLQRGEMYLGAGEYTKAQIDLYQVLHLQRASPEIHYIVAKLHRARGEEFSYREEMAKALELNSYLVQIRLELVQELLSTSNPQAALAALNQAPASQQESIPVLVQRNWVLWILGDLDGMRKGVDQGLTLERSADLLISRTACGSFDPGDPAGARNAVEEALKIDPSDLRALQTLKQTYLAQKNAPMALQRVREYAASQPKSAPVQDFLGLMLVSQGLRKEARAAL